MKRCRCVSPPFNIIDPRIYTNNRCSCRKLFRRTKSREYVFPRWLQKKFQLDQKRTLLNGTRNVAQDALTTFMQMFSPTALIDFARQWAVNEIEYGKSMRAYGQSGRICECVRRTLNLLMIFDRFGALCVLALCTPSSQLS
jgi:hypothetical protein